MKFTWQQACWDLGSWSWRRPVDKIVDNKKALSLMLDNHTSKCTIDWRTMAGSSVQVLWTRHLEYIHIIFRNLNENSWYCFWLLQIFRGYWLIELLELFERFFFSKPTVSFHFLIDLLSYSEFRNKHHCWWKSLSVFWEIFSNLWWVFSFKVV